MDGRFPYDPPGNTQRLQQQAQIQAAIEIEEALYLQRQRDIQRDLQIRQMILQDQIDQQLMQTQQNQRLFDSYGIPSQASLQALQEDQLLMQHQEQLRRQQLQQEMQLARALGNQTRSRDALVAEALAAEQQQAGVTRQPDLQTSNILPAMPQSSTPPQMQAKKEMQAKKQQKETKAMLKRKLEEAGEVEIVKPPTARKNSKRQEKQQKAAESSATPSPPPPKKKPRGKNQGRKSAPKAALKKEDKKLAVKKKSKPTTIDIDNEEDTNDSKEEIELAAALLDGVRKEEASKSTAAGDEKRMEDAATAIFGLRKNVEWSDSEDEEETPAESITIGEFHSQVPRLPIEPEYKFTSLEADAESKPVQEKAAEEETSAKVPPPKSKKELKQSKKETNSNNYNKSPASVAEYPFPVDTWWPANATIRRERRIRSEKSDEEDCADEATMKSEDGLSLFYGDMETTQHRLANDVEPGVLEKLPHCKIQKLRAKPVKGGPKVEPMFCFQVTETSCNDTMVCCSICSTWRHAFCGGHYEPYSVRSNLESATPFKAICDRCHEEAEHLRDYPKAQKRIERQRAEQCRRALATSSVIRQASFMKHGGTYKWPLGSVSATHIGGHTRSVHSRHDKAEKQWSEMSVRLGRGVGYRPKERTKVRTRELERLLVSVEDAEGVMDRHNMILFLQNDTGKENPVGFDRSKRNLFDPEDDQLEDLSPVEIKIDVGMPEEGSEDVNQDECFKATQKQDNIKDFGSECARNGCKGKARFDSVFCSDSCGVSSLEMDLLRALQSAGDIHPSLLRT